MQQEQWSQLIRCLTCTLHIAEAVAFSSFCDRSLLQRHLPLTSRGGFACMATRLCQATSLLSAILGEFGALCFSFLELHPHLSDELAWCPIAAEPSADLKTVSGGISQVFAEIIKLFFNDNFDLRIGMHLDGPEGEDASCRLFVDLSMFLQDGGAHKLLWGCKQDSGTRLCMLCSNLIAEASGLVDAYGGDIVVCSLIHEHQLCFATDRSVRGALNRLAAFKLTDGKTAFKLRQQAFGFKYQEHGVLQDPKLTDIVLPVSQYCHDWMHCLFAGGVFNIVVLQCFTEVHKIFPDIWSQLRDYVLKHTWPQSTKFSPSISDHFLPERVKSHRAAGVFKCPASDGLSLLPVMCMYLQTVVLRSHAVNKTACEALLALGDIVDALVCVPLGVVSPDYLRQRIHRFFTVCETAGWQQHFIPKFHWMIHLPQALARWGVLPTCWVHERKHRVVKKFGQDIRNTTTYSKSVLLEAISQQLVDVENPDAFDLSLGLIKPTAASKKERDFLAAELQLQLGCRTSNMARITSGATCSKTDCVLIKSDKAGHFMAGRVWLLADCATTTATALVGLWDFESQDASIGKAVWQMADRPCFVPVAQILCSVIWAELQDGFAITFVPFAFQGMRAAAD
jgi:hypothetical protein